MHDRQNRADIITLAKGVIFGMIFAAIGVGIAFILLISYYQPA